MPICSLPPKKVPKISYKVAFSGQNLSHLHRIFPVLPGAAAARGGNDCAPRWSIFMLPACSRYQRRPDCLLHENEPPPQNAAGWSYRPQNSRKQNRERRDVGVSGRVARLRRDANVSQCELSEEGNIFGLLYNIHVKMWKPFKKVH